jgi:hypothetical protein
MNRFGDFFQLPPVPNELIGDYGKFCFESKIWDTSFPHHIDLKTIYRQAEQDLIHAVSDLARGDVYK